jgi:glycosyltransferase involved in cell wall biosynthesis
LSGCALVLGDIPSLREIWQDAAIYVPVEDARRLAHELQALIHDDDRRAALGARARRAACRYSPDRMVSEYLKVYRKLLRDWHAKRDEDASVCA